MQIIYFALECNVIWKFPIETIKNGHILTKFKWTSPISIAYFLTEKFDILISNDFDFKWNPNAEAINEKWIQRLLTRKRRLMKDHELLAHSWRAQSTRK